MLESVWHLGLLTPEETRAMDQLLEVDGEYETQMTNDIRELDTRIISKRTNSGKTMEHGTGLRKETIPAIIDPDQLRTEIGKRCGQKLV